MTKLVNLTVTEEQVNFMKNLKDELLTQDSLATAKPNVFKISYYKKIPTLIKYADGMRIKFKRNIYTLTNVVELAESLRIFIEETYEFYGFDSGVLEKYKDTYSPAIVAAGGIKELYNVLIKFECEFEEMLSEGDFEIIPYLNHRVESCEFLTSVAAEEHLEAKRHNYESPFVYCTSAAENKELRQLTDFVINTDWEAIKI